MVSIFDSIYIVCYIGKAFDKIQHYSVIIVLKGLGMGGTSQHIKCNCQQ